MITNDGKLRIRQWLPGGGTNLASTIVVGVGSTAESANDTRLVFEVARIPINLISYDNVDNLLIFKGALDAAMVGKIYEIGLYTQPVNTVAGGYGSRLLTSFDQINETWTNATWDATYARIGADALKQAPTASTTATSVLNTSLDLSGYSGADLFLLAFNCENGNAASVVFRFKTDASNYYTFTTSNPASGYNIVSFTKAVGVVTGSPSWSDITSIEVATTAKAAGTAPVEFDGLRVEDVDSINPEYVMLARDVPASPITKVSGLIHEIEYGVSVTGI